MLCVVSSMPSRFAYWWRMPPLASAVEPEHTVSRSSTITRPAPSRARWYAVLTPMIPAPTITTSAVSVISGVFLSVSSASRRIALPEGPVKSSVVDFARLDVISGVRNPK